MSAMRNQGGKVNALKPGVLCVLLTGTAVAAPTNDGLYATLQTTMGDVCFEMYYTNVPRTVANFVSLAEGSRPWIDPRDGFVSTGPYYNNIIFHRVINDFMIQAGSPKGDGTDGPGYTLEDEFNPALRHDRPGVVSMANSGPDSNGGQFFITVAAYTNGNDKYSVFGRVVEGMNVVSNIAAVATTNDKPLIDVTITNVFITRNGTGAQSFSVTNQSLPEAASLPLSIVSGNGIKLSMGTATSSYQYVYTSTNLAGWTLYDSEYRMIPEGPRVELPAPSGLRGYFRAARVMYTPDTNGPVNPVSHQFVMTIDTDVFRVTPNGTNSGTVAVDGYSESSMTYWDWNRNRGPYQTGFYLESDGYYPFYFDLYYTTPTTGRCIGYVYYDGWYYIGDNGAGTFTDQPAN